MDDYLGDPVAPGRRERVLGSLDKMVESGRVTTTEAKVLRSAVDASEFAEAVIAIRVRHASTGLIAAVESGHLTRQDADALLERLKKGEHQATLRAGVRRHDPARLPDVREPVPPSPTEPTHE